MGFFPTDVASQLAVRTAVAPQAAVDDTPITGAGIDRLDMLSAVLVASFGFTTASGAAADTVTVDITIQHSDDDGVDDAYSDFETAQYVITVDDNDGAYTADVVLPVLLKPAKRYVRAVVELTHAGDGTLSAGLASAVLVGGGLVVKPDPAAAELTVVAPASP
jgi:hypothetical protein